MISSETPFVSIIIPVYDDPDGLRDTLESMVAQSYDEYEIIVSITPATGETLATAQEYSNDDRDEIKIVEVPSRGRAAGRNAGIEDSEGDVLAFVDADVRASEDWLREAIAEMDERNADYMACDIQFPHGSADMGFIERYERALSLPVEHYIKEYNFAPTASLFVTQEIISDVGGFDSRLTSSEDKEFGARIHDAGYELHFAPNLVMYHPVRSTFTSHYAKAIRIGHGTQQLYHYYPSRFSIPSLYSPLAYAPPHPSRIRDRIESNEYDPSFLEFILFYMFNYFLKIVQQYGRWEERKLLSTENDTR